MLDILIHNATIINEGQTYPGSIAIQDKKILAISRQPFPDTEAKQIIDATGLLLIPGIIDDQVHFREPGLTHKGDILSESRAAAAGGITSYMEMPNTIPKTITQNNLLDKFRIAEQQSLVNYSFYLGATNDNIKEITACDPARICGIKVFMGASTGNMLVDNPDSLKAIFSSSPILVAVHCEDEATIRAQILKYNFQPEQDIPMLYHPLIRNEESCYKSTALAVELAGKYNTQLHVLHLSTAKELDLFSSDDVKSKRITSEVCIHHLWFNDTDYERLQSRIKWNPSIKKKRDQEALLEAVLSGKIDIVATDHAPHTLTEKKASYFKCPSGGPMVQHSLVAMLELHHQGKISLEKIVEKMCHAPADLFKITKRGYLRKDYWADMVLIEPEKTWEVNESNILYKCKWSPFENNIFHFAIHTTFVNGEIVYSDGKIRKEIRGMALEFDR